MSDLRDHHTYCRCRACRRENSRVWRTRLFLALGCVLGFCAPTLLRWLIQGIVHFFQ